MAAEIGSQTGEILDPQHTELLRPQDTGIIVVDVMDAYFSRDSVISKLLNYDTTEMDLTAKRIKDFLEKARKFNPAAVVFTRMLERPDSMPPNLRRKMEMEDTPPWVEQDGPGWDYYLVSPEKADHEIVKKRYNSFKDTDLDQYLKSKGVSSLIIVGGYASRCVKATAQAAAGDLDYHTFIPEDLIANPAQIKDEVAPFLRGVREIYGYQTKAQTILNTWERSK